MTVKELIEKLEKVSDKNLPVFVGWGGSLWSGMEEVTEVARISAVSRKELENGEFAEGVQKVAFHAVKLR